MIQQLNSWSWLLRMSTPAPIPWPGNSGAGLNNRRKNTLNAIPNNQLLNLVFSSQPNNDQQIELSRPQPSKPAAKKSSKSITQLLAVTTGVAAGIARVSHRSLHDVWKSQKKSQSTLQAKLAMLTFWTDKSKLKMVHFGEFLKICSLRSNSVTRQVTFNRTKIGGKCQN